MGISPKEYLKALKDAFEKESQKYYDLLSDEVKGQLQRLKDLDQTYEGRLDIFSQEVIDTIHKVKFFNLFFCTKNEPVVNFLEKLHTQANDHNIGTLSYELRKHISEQKDKYRSQVNSSNLRQQWDANLKLQFYSEAEKIIKEVRTKLQNRES